MQASSYFNPAFFLLLQQLSLLHHIPHNHTQTLQQLAFIIESTPHVIIDYLPMIVTYLTQNIVRNIQLLRTIDSLVALRKHISIPLRKAVSSLLIKKYPFTDFRQQIKKLASINRSLIEPYLFLLSRISEWHQFQVLEQPHETKEGFELLFLLDYFRTLVTFEFETGKMLEGVGTWEPLLSIYSLVISKHTSIGMAQQKELKGLSSSLFYFLANWSITDFGRAKTMLSIIDALLSWIQQAGINFQEQILSEVMSILRRPHSLGKEQLIDGIQNAIRGLLCLRWSLDKEVQWSWVCKIIWDLMDIDPKEQVLMIKDLIGSGRDILKLLQLL